MPIRAHAALIEMHGIGPWTADIYLLFCLGHADAWPAGDLALQEAARIALGLKARPSAKELAVIADAWRPWRGVAAHLLWGYYHVVKRREGVAVDTKPKPGRETGRTKTNRESKTQWPDQTSRCCPDQALSQYPARPNASWCSCTATAPTATT